MFTYQPKLQYHVRVDRPDALYAKQLQELIGGKWGEMAVMISYLFQGWGLRGVEGDPRLRKLRDMCLDTGTEEIAHVEMLATCVGLLLEGASPEQQEEAAKKDPVVYAMLGGMNPQHMIVSGLCAQPADSVGVPYSGAYSGSSGNPIADLYLNATAEMHGRTQACRLYEMTTDRGVRDMLHFMIARDHMHQVQWLAAIEEFGGREAVLPTPADFPREKQMNEYALAFMAYHEHPAETTSGQGRWASGPSIDGKGEFSYIAEPFGVGQIPPLKAPPPTIHAGIPHGHANAEPSVEPPHKDGESVVEQLGNKLGGRS